MSESFSKKDSKQLVKQAGDFEAASMRVVSEKVNEDGTKIKVYPPVIAEGVLGRFPVNQNVFLTRNLRRRG